MEKKIITELSELPIELQIKIVDDIKTRILPQVDVLDAADKEAFIDAEISRSKELMQKLVRYAYGIEGTPETALGRNMTYVFNKEKIKALEKMRAGGRSGGEALYSLIDKDELCKLFKPVFQDKSFATIDTPTGSEKISRFDQFCSRLEMTLSNTKPTHKLIGEIAYLIYTSRYVDNKLKKPQKEGEKGVFTDLLKAFNTAINMKDFYLQPAKCCNPSDELKATFKMLQ